ncbi:uracil phosphoribosyltransferase [Bdellovibrio sp. HCB274]|uniref:uracil phosphoribosyltransferase n=1 Tax=Bdellovibrio sp. HCB274 TaxID=3394361 RepID=UPI0039B58647
MHARFKVINHPLLRHKLGYLRDRNTYSHDFRELVKEVTKILVYEAMKDWSHMEKVTIETPMSPATAYRISNPPIVVSVMRAGNGMLDAALSMLPFASTGFIGIYRDKFINNTVEYYFKMPPEVLGREVLLCDPLIATADTIIACIDRLKSYGVGKIKVLSILVSEKGLEKIQHFHPDVEILTLDIETEMNDMGYLIPGLGDAGDRLFQTK